MIVLFPAGDVAVQQRDLLGFATLLMLVVVIPVIVMAIVFSRKYSARRGGHNYDPHFDHSTGLELVIWSIPLLIITIIGAVTWRSTHLLDPFRPLDRIAPGKPLPPGTKHFEVQVVAMDWKWLFIYPEQGIATVNELALPVNVPVRFSMTSTSQFNTFYAPTMAGMIYVMPGMDAKLHAVLNKPVESFGYSGNYTGRGYSDMRFALHGLPPAQFNEWVARVKARGGLLQAANYIQLEKPSEKVPMMRFGAVSPGLYSRILNRCVEAGKPCVADVMMHDMMRGGSGVPQNRGGMPLNGQKPVPALQKAPEDKGSGPNVTKPEKPGSPPGQLKPGDQRNRDMSSLSPLSIPGARSAARSV
ncbi:COX aromatic rich motif-containing protein [Sphingomonas sp. NPDC079357]|uniref:ubiquinol oxidase subunit II n=1 Tax=Sphingomonas sp. NPDC079357 TaxID=3364518 RepID=UPI003850609B